MANISDLPVLHDIDAGCSPQYVKLARALRGQIGSGQYRQGDTLPAADLAREYKASIRVTYCAPAMLAANRYISRPEAVVVLQRHLAGGDITPGRRRRADEIPAEQSAVAGANISALHQRKGWTQAELGDLMGWPTTATVCAAEGHRDGRQRGFTAEEIKRLAIIFGVSALSSSSRGAPTAAGARRRGSPA